MEDALNPCGTGGPAGDQRVRRRAGGRGRVPSLLCVPGAAGAAVGCHGGDGGDGRKVRGGLHVGARGAESRDAARVEWGLAPPQGWAGAPSAWGPLTHTHTHAHSRAHTHAHTCTHTHTHTPLSKHPWLATTPRCRKAVFTEPRAASEVEAVLQRYAQVGCRGSSTRVMVPAAAAQLA